MNVLVWLALALAIAWGLIVAVFKVVSFAVHLILVAAVALFLAWGARKMLHRGEGPKALR